MFREKSRLIVTAMLVVIGIGYLGLANGQPGPPDASTSTDSVTKLGAGANADDPAGEAPEVAHASLVFDKKEYFLGENILMMYRLENISQETFKIEVGGDYRGSSRHLRFKVTATDAQGKKVADPDQSGMNMGGMGAGPEIQPGKAYEQSLPLLRYCRFDRPGIYTLRMTHELGWKNRKGRKAPTGEATLKLVMPNRDQARAVVEEMYRLPAGNPFMGGKCEPYGDFATLAYPIYLPILAERAVDGCDKALTGIGQIPTPEATKVLVDLLGHRDPAFAVKVAQTLNQRLPDPDREGKSPEKGEFYCKAHYERHWLVSTSWRPQFGPLIRPQALKLVARDDPDSKVCGAFMLKCVGGPEDWPALLESLTAALKQSKDAPEGKGSYPRPRDVCRTLLQTALLGKLRGERQPTHPKTASEAVVFLSLIGTDAKYRPPDWEDTYAPFLGQDIPFVRVIALENLPVPVSKPLVRQVLPRFADADAEVLLAACQVADKSKIEEFHAPVLKVLASAKEERLLRTASDALWNLGARYEYLELWVSRLEEEGMAQTGIRYLSRVVNENCGSGSNGPLDADTARAAKARWTAFLKQHRQRLTEGRLFKIGDPSLTADLFPGFMFYRNNQPSWP